MQSNPTSASEQVSASYFQAVHGSIQRLQSQSASCKLWSLVIVTSVLALAASGFGSDKILWCAAPALLLAFLDAGYQSQASRLAAAAGSKDKTALLLQSQASWPTAVMQTLSGLLAPSVLPYYLCLCVATPVLGGEVLEAKRVPIPAPAPVRFSPAQANVPQSKPSIGAPSIPGSLPNARPTVGSPSPFSRTGTGTGSVPVMIPPTTSKGPTVRPPMTPSPRPVESNPSKGTPMTITPTATPQAAVPASPPATVPPPVGGANPVTPPSSGKPNP